MNKPGHKQTGTMGEIETHVGRLLTSRAKRRGLALCSRDGQEVYARLRHEKGVCSLTVTLEGHPLREQAVRRLFRERAITPESDWAEDHFRYICYPLPDVAAAYITSQLMKQVYGLDEQGELDFVYVENDSA